MLQLCASLPFFIFVISSRSVSSCPLTRPKHLSMPLLRPIYTVRFLSHATTGYDMIYDCCVRQKKCRSILKHVLKRCDNRKSCRRPVASLPHATKIVPCKSALTCKVDYCNSRLYGQPKCVLRDLQRVLNCSARLIYSTSKFEHVTPQF